MSAREPLEVSPQLDGWRYQYVAPVGLYSGFTEVNGGRVATSSWDGWYYRSRAECAWHRHHTPPMPECSCGLYFVTDPTPAWAGMLEVAAGVRDRVEEFADQIGLLLQRVTAWDCLPTPFRSDPPTTMRALRVQATAWYCDNERAVDQIKGDDRLVGFPPIEYVPDLAAWMREQSDADLAAYLEKVLP